MSDISRFFQNWFLPLVIGGPPFAIRAAMRATGSIFYQLNGDERRIVDENITSLLGPGHKAELTKKSVHMHTIDHYFEKILVASRSAPYLRRFIEQRVQCQGLENLDQALSLKKGVLGVIAHWGAVEFIPPALAHRAYPITVVMEAKTPRLRVALERLVNSADVELLMASRGDRILESIFSALERNRIVLTEVDEVDTWRRRPSRTIQLFGKTLYFDHSIDFIAKKSMAPTVAFFCKREPRLRYSMRCESLALNPRSDNVSAKAYEIWERYTLQHPEQWYQWKKWGDMLAEPAADLVAP